MSTRGLCRALALAVLVFFSALASSVRAANPTLIQSLPAPHSAPTVAPTVAPSPTTHLEGWMPGALGLAISPDGRTAYVPFETEDTVLLVDLPTMTLTGAVDVSAAGTMLMSSAAALTPDGKTLYVSNGGRRNVIAIDTQTRAVTAVLPLQPIHGAAMPLSADGQTAYVLSEDGSLYAIHTTDNSYRRIWLPGVCFRAVAPSPGHPNLLYAVARNCSGSGAGAASFLALDAISLTIVRSLPLADPLTADPGARVNRLAINADETRAYFGSFRQVGDRGTGTFTVVDLDSFQVVAAAPLDNGVADFTLNEALGTIYILGLWSGGSAPGALPIFAWDMATNQLSSPITVAPSSDQRAIVVDPTNPHALYMTDGDANLLRKIDLDSGQQVGDVHFTHATLQPYAIVRDQGIGYVVSGRAPRVFRFNLASGEFLGSFLAPEGLNGWGFYQDRLYAGGGNRILALDPASGTVLASYPLDTWIVPGFFTFYGDRMVTLDYEPGGMVAKRLLLFDAPTMTLIKAKDLPPDPYGDKVIVSPDGSKLYVERGYMSTGGATVITIFDGATLEVLDTLEIPGAQPPRRGATSFVEGAFDEERRLLYLLGHASVYVLDMDNNRLLGCLDTVDAYNAQGISGWSPSGLSGVALSSAKDKLFVVSLDAHVMFTYDLAHAAWSPQITNLRGYFNTDALASPNGRFIYTVNQQSDSVTQVDLSSGHVAQVIYLQDLVHAAYIPLLSKGR